MSKNKFNKIPVEFEIKEVNRIESEANFYTGFKKGSKKDKGLLGDFNGTRLYSEEKAGVNIVIEEVEEPHHTYIIDILKIIKEETNWKNINERRFKALKDGLIGEVIHTFLIEDVDYDFAELNHQLANLIIFIAYKYDQKKKKK